MQVGIWMMWWRVLPISPVVSSSCDSQNHQVLGIAVYGSVWVDSYAPKASAASWLGAMQVAWQTLQVGRCLWGRLLISYLCAHGGTLRHFRGKLPLWTCGWIHSCRQGLPQLPSQFLSRVQLERLHLCEIWRLLEALGSGVLYQPCLAPWPPSKSGFLVKLRIPNISRTCCQRSQNTIPLV